MALASSNGETNNLPLPPCGGGLFFLASEASLEKQGEG
jgi:hypothetical protein